MILSEDSAELDWQQPQHAFCDEAIALPRRNVRCMAASALPGKPIRSFIIALKTSGIGSGQCQPMERQARIRA